MERQRFYTVPEVAKLLRVSRQHIYFLLRHKKLRGIRIGGPKARIRIRDEDLEDLVSSGSPVGKRA